MVWFTRPPSFSSSLQKWVWLEKERPDPLTNFEPVGWSIEEIAAHLYLVIPSCLL